MSQVSCGTFRLPAPVVHRVVEYHASYEERVEDVRLGGHVHAVWVDANFRYAWAAEDTVERCLRDAVGWVCTPQNQFRKS
jgi:hypothetical protein